MKVGVLALQGCVEPHRKHLEALKVECVELRSLKELRTCDALILPGGESTTQLKLHHRFGFDQELPRYMTDHVVWGICAGSILMAEDVRNPAQFSYGVFPVQAVRNAYGRQKDSFTAEVLGAPTAFIRAPQLIPLRSSVEVLASVDGNAVFMKHGHHLVSSCHPELSQAAPHPMYRVFLEMILAQNQNRTNELIQRT